MSVGSGVAAGLGLVALVAAVLRVRRPGTFPLATLLDGWLGRLPSPGQVLVGAAAGVVSVLAGPVVALALGWGEVRTAVPLTLSWVGLACAGIAVKGLYALFEEIIFRGALVSELRRWTGSGPAVVVSAIVFALAHGGRSVVDLAILAADGAGFAIAFVVTGRLWVPLVWHLAKNVTVWAVYGRGTLDVVAGPAVFRSYGPEWLVGSATGAGVIDLGAAVLVVSVVSWNLLHRPSQ